MLPSQNEKDSYYLIQNGNGFALHFFAKKRMQLDKFFPNIKTCVLSNLIWPLADFYKEDARFSIFFLQEHNFR